MDNTKFNLVSIVLFVVLVGLGVLAFFTLTPPKRYSEKHQNNLMEEQVVVNDIDESTVGTIVDTTEPATAEPVTPTTATVTTTTTASTEHAELLEKLQGLIDDKIVMKVGSKGTRVGTVQKFLNIYLGTTKTVDNQYGEGTKADVIKFQKDQGLTADGQPGPGTYQKMIDWLKK